MEHAKSVLEDFMKAKQDFEEAKKRLKELGEEELKKLYSGFQEGHKSRIAQSFEGALQQFNDSFQDIYLVNLAIKNTPNHYFAIEILRRIKSSDLNPREPLEVMASCKELDMDEFGMLPDIKMGFVDGEYDPESLALAENSCYTWIRVHRAEEKKQHQHGYALLGIDDQGMYEIKHLSSEAPKLPDKLEEQLIIEKIWAEL